MFINFFFFFFSNWYKSSVQDTDHKYKTRLSLGINCNSLQLNLFRNNWHCLQSEIEHWTGRNTNMIWYRLPSLPRSPSYGLSGILTHQLLDKGPAFQVLVPSLILIWPKLMFLVTINKGSSSPPAECPAEIPKPPVPGGNPELEWVGCAAKPPWQDKCHGYSPVWPCHGDTALRMEWTSPPSTAGDRDTKQDAWSQPWHPWASPMSQQVAHGLWPSAKQTFHIIPQVHKNHPQVFGSKWHKHGSICWCFFSHS